MADGAKRRTTRTSRDNSNGKKLQRVTSKDEKEDQQMSGGSAGDRAEGRSKRATSKDEKEDQQMSGGSAGDRAEGRSKRATSKDEKEGQQMSGGSAGDGAEGRPKRATAAGGKAQDRAGATAGSKPRGRRSLAVPAKTPDNNTTTTTTTTTTTGRQGSAQRSKRASVSTPRSAVVPKATRGRKLTPRPREADGNEMDRFRWRIESSSNTRETDSDSLDSELSCSCSDCEFEDWVRSKKQPAPKRAPEVVEEYCGIFMPD